MRTLILLSLSLSITAPQASAQSLEEMMKKAMEGQQQGANGTGTGVTVEENTAPFVPLGFTGSYRMEVHQFRNGVEEKESPTNVRMAFTDDRMAMAPEMTGKTGGSMRMVHDLKNKYTYTLTTDEKGKRTGMKMKMMKVKVDDVNKEDDEGSKVIRTDEMKVIDGHPCRKYTYSDEGGSGEAWIAEDVSFNPSKALASMMVDSRRSEQWQQAPFAGLMMETTWKDANGKDSTVMYTKDLVVGKVDEALFSTAGYEMMDMSNYPMFGK
ncbi:MAG: DUF4412 domain-containing protein [Flavobacteriales bacterium]